MYRRVSTRAALATISVVIALATGAVAASAAELVSLDPLRGIVSPPSHGPQQCWQWSSDRRDWTWVCNAGAYQRAYAANPLKAGPPVHYDYPSYGPGPSGSSLSFVLGRDIHEPPPGQAE
jgi:hypothetical protein